MRKPRALTRPGERLRAIAARVCSAKTMDRFIDPIVADLQTECAEAVRQGRRWKSRWIRMAGCAAFLKVLVFTAYEGSVRTLHDWIADTDQATAQTLRLCVGGIVLFSIALQIPTLLDLPTWPLRNRGGCLFT